MFRFGLLVHLLLLAHGFLAAQDTTGLASEAWVCIDSIEIERNWRTKDLIIRRELRLPMGQTIARHAIDTAMNRLWNTGNFVLVNYRLDSLPTGQQVLRVVAKDRFTTVPIVAVAGNRKEYRLGFGLKDDNLMGKNIELYLHAGFTNIGSLYEFRLKVPRQLLPDNAEIYAEWVKGHERYHRLHRGQATEYVAYRKSDVYLNLGNPRHEDYRYVFSPNLGLAFRQHRSDNTSSADYPDVPTLAPYEADLLEASIEETIGTVNVKRHRKHGYFAYSQVAYGLGLQQSEHNYWSLRVGAEGHVCLNSWLQLSVMGNYAYTNSQLASLQYLIGPNRVKGIRTGELYGRAYYYAYAGLHFTLINREWLALEQGLFVNWGRGTMQPGQLWRLQPIGAVGTSFTFNVPMISFLEGKISISYTMGQFNQFEVYF